MRFVTFFSFSVAIFCGGNLYSTDFTRFLTSDSWRPEGPSVAIDSFGNRLFFRELPPVERNFLVASSVLSDALGVPSLPQYPAFLPTSSHDPALRPVVLSPYLDPTGGRPPKISAVSAADRVGNALVDFVLGSKSDTRPLPDMGGSTSSRVRVAAVVRNSPFTGFGDEKKPSLAKILNEIPVGWENANKDDLAEIKRRTLKFLERLENIPQDKLIQLLGPTFRAAAKQTNQPIGFYEQHVRERLNSVKNEVETFFVQQEALPRPKGPLSPAERLYFPPPPGSGGHPNHSVQPPPELNDVPNIGFPGIQDHPSHSSDEKPTEMLWRVFSAPTLEDAQSVLSALPLTVPNNQKVSLLLSKATSDPESIYDVSPYLRAQDRFHPEPERTQFVLNPENRKTLVVVPVNDEEASEVARVATQSGAGVMALDRNKYPHGSRLTRGLALQVLLRAKTGGYSRVMIVELPGQTPEIEQMLQGKGFDLQIVDHHDYADMKRHASKSSLEQVADQLGYNLSPHSKLIAVMDRAYIYGLLDMGLPKSELGYWIDPAVMRALPQPSANTSFGNIYLLDDRDRGMEMKRLGIAAREYPHIPNIFSVHDGWVKFSGNPELARRLEALGSRFVEEGSKTANYSGGDLKRSMFWGIRDVTPNDFPKLLVEVGKLLNDSVKPGIPKIASFGGKTLEPASQWLVSMPKEKVLKAVTRLHWDRLTSEDKRAIEDWASKATDWEKRVRLSEWAAQEGATELAPAVDRWLAELKQLELADRNEKAAAQNKGSKWKSMLHKVFGDAIPLNKDIQFLESILRQNKNSILRRRPTNCHFEDLIRRDE